MPLTTLRFDTLRERNNRSLERAGYRPDVTDIAKEQRRRIDALLGKRVDIEELASTTNQREAYGLERWQEEFVRLQEIPDDAGEKLRERIWKAVPHSRFKRFQELFCAGDHFVVPAFDVGEGGNVTFRSAPDFNTLSLAPCLVSPDLIPDDLAASLHLCDFTQEDHRQPERRLRKKHAAVPRLKKVWEAAVPLQEGHHRVLVVEAPDAEVEGRYPGDAAPDADVQGTILYVREADRQNGDDRRLQVQHFRSAYDAHRKTLHEEHIYQKENKALATMMADLQALNGKLDRDWKEPEQREALRTRVESLLTRCIAQLEHCVNIFKVDAASLLAAVTDMRDSRGRENITVTMTKLVAAVNRFNSRYAEMYPKGGYNQQDRMALETHLHLQERILWTFRSSLEEGAPALERPSALFDERTMTNAQVDGNALGLLRNMGMDPHPLDHLTLQPLRTYGRGMREGHEDLRAALVCRDRDMAIDATIRMHLLGKFQSVRQWFEKLKADMTDARTLSVSRIRTFVTSLQKLFSTRQIFPDLVMEEYREPFEQLERGLAGILDLLRPFEGRELDIDQRTALYKQLKEYLEQYDIEKLATVFAA